MEEGKHFETSLPMGYIVQEPQERKGDGFAQFGETRVGKSRNKVMEKSQLNVKTLLGKMY